MTADTTQYAPNASDLALIVWPGQTAVRAVAAGTSSWADVAQGPWTMSASKAENVRVVVAVNREIVVGAWSVLERSSKPWVAPTGRTLHKCSFELVADARAGALIGHPSPQSSRRNPLCLMQLRDVPGYRSGDDDVIAPFGRAQLGDYTLTVFQDGTAEVLVPAHGSVLVRPAGATAQPEQ